MWLRKSIFIFLAIAIAIFLSGAFLFFDIQGIVQPRVNKLLSNSSQKSTSIANLQPSKQIDESGRGLSFTVNSKFPKRDKYLEFLKDSPIAHHTLSVVISPDVQNAQVRSVVVGDTVMSGHRIENLEGSTHIYLFISSELTDPLIIRNELAKNYLNAIVTASEYKKYTLDPNYLPQYAEAALLVNDLLIEANDYNEYPIEVQ